ncbi:hypothetical protein [Candidatus Accumulibacter sp. ACC003]|uniref:hypothetical protein n=1 Tax=Candidatus Accumulibacter sp. ACC003 TaxID=2823334 RepID=UPI0025C002DE|nr:hypothetical protein [Candidatus Accumulibacter sp. ACC003]
MNDKHQGKVVVNTARAADALDCALRAYAEQPQFRSAEGHEVIFDNPFHRPVRAHDLSFLDFSRPIDQQQAYALSALMGNRMLLNIYEADLPFVGQLSSAQSVADRMAFYSTGNRALGEQVRPALERHCFAWVDDSADSADEQEQTTTDLIERSLAQFVDSARAVAQAIDAADAPTRMAQLLAIQICGPLRARDLALQRYAIAGSDGLWGDWIAAAVRAAHTRRRGTSALARAAQLSETPHAYWQFYLGSQLAVANYLSRALRDPSRFFEAVGAIAIDRLCSVELARCWRDLLVSAFGPDAAPSSGRAVCANEALASEVLSRIEQLPGMRQTECLRAFQRGVQGMCQILVAANDDLVQQIAWAGHAIDNRRLAEDYTRVIRERSLAVDMETYVEPSSERSTTHVHDTDRLLVIESGEMDFWHSYGEPLHFVPGDMIFVPRHRLHGSVVTTSQCVYHQPIVDGELREFFAHLRPMH